MSEYLSPDEQHQYPQQILKSKTIKLLKQREDDEIEYQKLLSKRPQGGSGVLESSNSNLIPTSSTFIPDDSCVMKTMQDLDIDWEEAKQFLITENEINFPSKKVDWEHTQLRKMRLAKIQSEEKHLFKKIT